MTYRSAIGHTVSRDVNSQARVHQVWTLKCSEMQNFSHGLVFPVWRIRMHMNGSQWIEKCNVTSPLHICLDIIWINQITLRRDLNVFVVGWGLSKSRNQPLMHLTYPHHITQFLCVFLRHTFMTLHSTLNINQCGRNLPHKKQGLFLQLLHNRSRHKA